MSTLNEEEILSEELLALQAIFDDAITVAYPDTSNSNTTFVSYSHNELHLRFTCLRGYPELVPLIECGLLRRAQKLTELEELAKSLAGTPMLYQLIDSAKDVMSCVKPADATRIDDGVSSNSSIHNNSTSGNEGDGEEAQRIKSLEDELRSYATAGVAGNMEADLVEIFHGEVTTERRSVFQSHLAHVSSMEEVDWFHRRILCDRRYSRATHNIFAYRFTAASSGIVYHDCDDDGESAAGGRLAELLRLMGVSGVALIVSRWFGGTLLGPDRFKFINNSARRLLEQHELGYQGNRGPTSSNSIGKSKKKNK